MTGRRDPFPICVGLVFLTLAVNVVLSAAVPEPSVHLARVLDMCERVFEAGAWTIFGMLAGRLPTR